MEEPKCKNLSRRYIDNTGRRNDNAKTKEKYFEPCIQVGVHI